MGKYLDNTDLAVVRSAGFVAGITGYVWWGLDTKGQSWSVQEDDDSGQLMFYPEGQRGRPMTRQELGDTFSIY